MSSVIMKVVNQNVQLPIHNNDLPLFGAGMVNQRKRHGPLFPDTIRAIVCGPSNCGKTNMLISILENINGPRFANIYIFSKSLHQEKFRWLEAVLEPLESIKIFKFSYNEDVVTPENVLPYSIMIFDDVSTDNQDVIRAYFSMGRHQKVDVFYLTQTYTRVPKHLIRDNANFIILFKQDGLNMRHVYDDHVNTDMTFTQFQNMCALCWNSSDYGFLVIDKDNKMNDGRYRLGFDKYIMM